MGFIIVVLIMAAALWYRRPEWWARQIGERVRSLKAWKVAGLLWLALVVASIVAFLPIGLILALIVFVPFWLHEVWTLVHLNDDAFPGRNDKLIWALYLLFCPPVGVVLFRAFRERNWASASQAKQSGVGDWI